MHLRYGAALMSLRGVTFECRILALSLLDWRSAPLSKLFLLVGVGYLFIPVDLIPDRIPIIGHFDEAGFVLAGFVGSRLLVPKHRYEVYGDDKAGVYPGPWQQVQFMIRIVRADLSNFFLYQYRQMHGFLVTGKNSGTHWVKFMLSCAMAGQYGVPRPLHSSGRDADAIISHPRWPVNYPSIPRIGSSHTIPSIAFRWRWLTRAAPFRPVVVLVRNISDAMISHYLKWQDEYQVPLADYVRGDPSGRQYRADIWWYIHFFNRWGDLAAVHPQSVLVVRYEDVQADPAASLWRIARHLRADLDDADVAAALRFASRDSIRTVLDPRANEVIVPDDDATRSVIYSADDEAFMDNAFARFLRHDFGYGRS
jgi:uncharacterized membrane protein YkvA (DUF1232 family)